MAKQSSWFSPSRPALLAVFFISVNDITYLFAQAKSPGITFDISFSHATSSPPTNSEWSTLKVYPESDPFSLPPLLPAFARPLSFVTQTAAVASLLPHTSTRVIFPGCESGLSSPPETADSDYRVLPVTWLLAASLISFSTTQPFERPLLSLENGEHIPISGALPLAPPQLGMLFPSRLAWLTPSPCSGLSSNASGSLLLTNLPKTALAAILCPLMLLHFFLQHTWPYNIICICLFGIFGHIRH